MIVQPWKVIYEQSFNQNMVEQYYYTVQIKLTGACACTYLTGQHRARPNYVELCFYRAKV